MVIKKYRAKMLGNVLNSKRFGDSEEYYFLINLSWTHLTLNFSLFWLKGVKTVIQSNPLNS